jgi:hypothetical protein
MPVTELAEKIVRLAETPAEYGAAHEAAQSQLAAMAYELAKLVLESRESG